MNQGPKMLATHLCSDQRQDFSETLNRLPCLWTIKLKDMGSQGTVQSRFNFIEKIDRKVINEVREISKSRKGFQERKKIMELLCLEVFIGQCQNLDKDWETIYWNWLICAIMGWENVRITSYMHALPGQAGRWSWDVHVVLIQLEVADPLLCPSLSPTLLAID